MRLNVQGLWWRQVAGAAALPLAIAATPWLSQPPGGARGWLGCASVHCCDPAQWLTCPDFLNHSMLCIVTRQGAFPGQPQTHISLLEYSAVSEACCIVAELCTHSWAALRTSAVAPLTASNTRSCIKHAIRWHKAGVTWQLEAFTRVQGEFKYAVSAAAGDAYERQRWDGGAGAERRHSGGGRDGSIVPPEVDFEAKAQDVPPEFRSEAGMHDAAALLLPRCSGCTQIAHAFRGQSSLSRVLCLSNKLASGWTCSGIVTRSGKSPTLVTLLHLQAAQADVAAGTPAAPPADRSAGCIRRGH